ncbi:MAG: hypothetical protein WAM97_18760 [Acidimicrobiales bacterium]|jgi:hypothetical protein
MVLFIGRTKSLVANRRVLVLVVTALFLGGFCLNACGVVKAVDKIAHDVHGNKQKIDAFTDKVQSGESQPFEATYVTTGSSPAKIVYAVQPPMDVAFSDTPATSAVNGSNFDLIVNSTGEFNCDPPASSSSTWTCNKLGTASSSTDNSLVDFYTPSHWVTFLRDFALAAGIAGDKVSNSTMSVNGFSLTCVDLVAPGVTGTSTICTTAQGILGYVKVASDSTSFEIESYSATPPASEFQLPPGAKVVVPPSTTTTSAP